MSECVVRMEMPKNCAVCPFVTQYSRCVFLGMYAIDEERRADNCPTICQLPEGHGRLVDADALKEWFIEQIDYYKRFDGPNCSMMVSTYEVVCQVINDAPTIVPAEAERSET